MMVSWDARHFEALLRKAAKRALDCLWTEIGKALDLFTSDEYVDHIGSVSRPRRISD